MKVMLSYFIILMQVLVLSSCNQKPKPETYLIPEGFKGRATVIFNQKKGVPSKYENGRRIYEIPANGILLTQFKEEYGFIDHQYYYVDSSSKRTALEIFKDEKSTDSTIKADRNKVGIFEDGTTGQYTNNSEAAPFQFFFVTSYNGFDTIETHDHFNKRINKLIGTNL